MEQYILVKHDAKDRGTHYDLRFEIPGKKDWASFATTKDSKEVPPPEGNERMTLIRTNDHSKKEATFTGTIKSGYGAGKITEVESGKCDVLKFSDRHITIDFKGKKLKGKYHLVNTKVFSKGKSDDKDIYQFFKAKK